MSALVTWYGPAVERLGWVLIHFVWQGAAIALLLAGALQLAARVTARTRYALAGAALLLCAVAPILTWMALAPPNEAPLNPSQMVSRDVAIPTTSRLIPAVAPTNLAPTSWPATTTPWSVQLAAEAAQALPFIVGAWLSGVVILSTRLALGWRWTQRLVRSAVPLQDPICRDNFIRLRTRMLIARPVRLLESALAEVPLLIGWLRPVILLPVSLYAGLTPAQMEAFLAHELAHVRRHDYLVNLLQTLLETVLFYHPAVWWIGRRLRAERENCCDDLALEVMQDRLVYASALARLEEGRPAALALTATGGSLLARIRRIADAGERKASAWPAVSLLAVLLIAACVAKKQVALVKSASPAAPPGESAADKRFDFLHNQLRLEDVKATDMPLDQFVSMIAQKMAAQDPLKKGPNLVLSVPPGEPPLRVSVDFSTRPGYRANESMIFDYLKHRYPIRYWLDDDGTTYLQQISRDEIAFTKKAKATRIDIDFSHADPVEALAQVQAASADRGFKFDLDTKVIRALDALRPLPRIDLSAHDVSVDQALRSICYLADLRAQPLDHFAGYTFQCYAPEATRALTYLEVGTKVISFAPGAVEEKQTWDGLCKWTPWEGPALRGHAYPPLGPAISEMNPKNDWGTSISVSAKVVNKTDFQLDLALEIKDPTGRGVGKATGSVVVPSGVRVLLASHGHPAVMVPGQDSRPEQGFIAVVQATLMNRDGEPLLPEPPVPGVQEVEASAVGRAPSPSLGAINPTSTKQIVEDPSGPTAKTAAGSKGMIITRFQIMQVDDDDYRAHLSEIDAAVKRGDPEPLTRLRSFDLLSEPEAIMRSGESATLEAVRELPVAVKFSKEGSRTYPTNFERRDIGVRIPISATRVGDKIDLSGKLSVSTFEGWTESEPGTFSPSINTTDAYFFREIGSGQTVGFEAAGGQGHAAPDIRTVGYQPLPPKLTRLFFFVTAADAIDRAHAERTTF